jgi:hypothetical protein
VKWRGLFRLLHRDLGYTVVALTLAYGLSGLAVNHIDDWNPNYRFATREVNLGPLPAGTPAEQAAFVIQALRLPTARVRGHLQDSATVLRVFLHDGEEVSVNITSGSGQHKLVERRPVLFQVNALHLNNLKGAWTYVADVFAVALMLLAITGASMMKGQAGFLGRGKWFVGAGLLVPVGFLLYLTL